MAVKILGVLKGLHEKTEKIFREVSSVLCNAPSSSWFKSLIEESLSLHAEII